MRARLISVLTVLLLALGLVACDTEAGLEEDTQEVQDEAGEVGEELEQEAGEELEEED